VKKILVGLVAAVLATAAHAQDVNNHAFAIGKGPGVTGYTSLLCGSGQLAIGGAGVDPVCATVSGDGTLSAAGVLTVTGAGGAPFGTGVAAALGIAVNAANGVVTNTAGNQVSRGMLAQGVARSVIGNSTNLTANVADIQGTTANTFLGVNGAGTALAFSQVSLAAGTGVTGTLPIANGGTNDTGTAWTTFTPTLTCGTATFTVNSARSKTLGKTVWISLDFTITAIGTCTLQLTFTLPATPQSGGGMAGYTINGAVGAACSLPPASATATCGKANSANFGVNEVHRLSGTYESQ
jgi:hypothetical protein